MKNKKDYTIEGVEEVLARLPEDQREGARKAITDMLADFDPDAPPGQPVIQIPLGQSTCPLCSGPIHADAKGIHVPTGDTVDVVDFFECPKCDRAFVAPAAS